MNRATPPTPDPRERGEDAEQPSRVAHAIALGAEGLPPRDYQCLARAYLALRAPAPSEAVAEDDRALLFAAWLTTRPGVMTVGASEHAGPMAEAVHEWQKANPHPAPAPVVSEAMVREAVMSAIEQAVTSCVEQAEKRLPTKLWSVDYAGILGRVTAALTPDAEGGR